MNETKVAAGWTMGFDPEGRETLIVAIKATFSIPGDGSDLRLADEQVPLTKADQFTGEPGFSAPLLETDYAHRKVLCDVLVNATAYAPEGKPVGRCGVGVKVGSMAKTFAVVGNRVWRNGVTGVRATTPEPFVVMPISYDNAFGGVDDSKGDPNNVKTFLLNPVGRGYSHYKDRIDGRPLANTEEMKRAIDDPRGPYRPMSFGPVGRGWQPRIAFAGTYDKKWTDTRAPFWPADFDYRYFQAAPADQQIPFPTGGEDVLLKNLTPDGHLAFRLPKFAPPVLFIPRHGADRTLTAAIDTIVITPDERIISLTARAVYPLRRNPFELKQVVAGEMPSGWHRARRASHKRYYRSLGELVSARRGER